MSEFHQNKEIFKIISEAKKKIESVTGKEYVFVCCKKTDTALITKDDLLLIVSSVCGIPVSDIMSKCRRRGFSDARKCFVYVARLLGITTDDCADLAKYMDSDHSTILSRYRTATNMLIGGFLVFTNNVNKCIEMALNQSNVQSVSNLIQCGEMPDLESNPHGETS